VVARTLPLEASDNTSLAKAASLAAAAYLLLIVQG